MGARQPSRHTISDGMAEGEGRRRHRQGADHRRLEELEFTLAIREQVILQRGDIHLYFRDHALEVEIVLEWYHLDPLCKRRQQPVRWREASDSEIDAGIGCQQPGERWRGHREVLVMGRRAAEVTNRHALVAAETPPSLGIEEPARGRLLVRG